MSDTCRSCGAPVRWAITQHENRMPVDPEPVENGNLILIDRDGELHVAHAVPGTHVSHYATCPDAERWRRRSGPR
jgi:hypothetical protein